MDVFSSLVLATKPLSETALTCSPLPAFGSDAVQGQPQFFRIRQAGLEVGNVLCLTLGPSLPDEIWLLVWYQPLDLRPQLLRKEVSGFRFKP